MKIQSVLIGNYKQVLLHQVEVTTQLNTKGDELNFTICPDNYTADSFYSLHPKFNILELTKPLQITNAITIPKPVVSTQSAWLES